MSAKNTPPLRLESLGELKQIARVLRQQREEAQAALRIAQEKRARQEAEINLFQRSVGKVTPLQTTERQQHTRTAPAPLPLQLQLDEARVLRESLSDDFDVSSLLETDDSLSYRQPGVSDDVVRKLRQGHWSIQAHLDLHGLRVDEAREALGAFIRHSRNKGLRCIRVIHGKGHGSPGRKPVLKSRVHRWLVQKNEVIAFVQAKGSEGGAGAIVALLDRS